LLSSSTIEASALAGGNIKLLRAHACETGGFSRLILKDERKKIYCRPHSCNNVSTSRARTGRYSNKEDEPQRFSETSISEA
jgi:hypothetical protein